MADRERPSPSPAGAPVGVDGSRAAGSGERRGSERVMLLGIQDDEEEEEEEINYEALYSQSEGSTEGEETLFEAQEVVREGGGAGGPEEEKTMTVLEDDQYTCSSRECKQLREERDNLKKEMTVLKTAERQKEQSFRDIYRELEQKCFDQQEKIDMLVGELENERRSSEEKLTSMEEELAARVNELRALCEDTSQEKEGLSSRLALLDEEKQKLIEQVTTAERQQKDAVKECERLQAVMKKQKSELTKMKSGHDKSEAKRTEQSHELARMKDELSSVNIKLKWAQNKLKTETETHKKTETQLQQANKKLKEAREEGEQIRADLKTMITQYQVSEEMRSNSLGRQLQETERELKQQEQEIADQQELHELTIKELELAKTAHKIAQDECQQYKEKISELHSRLQEKATEIEELNGVISRQKSDQKKLVVEMSGMEQLNHSIESDRSKLAVLRDSNAQLQKRKEHLDREVERRKEREEELLAFSEKLSTTNAELLTEKSSWESKMASLLEERDLLSSTLAEAQHSRDSLSSELESLREVSQAQISDLLEKLEDKSQAVKQLTLSLEEEREQVKATRRKNTSNIKDLQRQLQQCKRRIEQLEAAGASEREPPPTLPISDGDRASSHSSLDGIGVPSPLPVAMATGGQRSGGRTPDEDFTRSTPSPELFQTLDQEKMMLVERLCRLKRELAKKDERMGFYEEHSQQLTEDIQRKSRIIQSFIVREQSGALAPPSSDVHKVKHSRKSGIMAAVFSGKPARTHPEMTLELSLEMNKKMQSVLEDTLLKNITLKENVDTLGQEIQRLSSKLQAHENTGR